MVIVSSRRPDVLNKMRTKEILSVTSDNVASNPSESYSIAFLRVSLTISPYSVYLLATYSQKFQGTLSCLFVFLILLLKYYALYVSGKFCSIYPPRD